MLLRRISRASSQESSLLIGKSVIELEKQSSSETLVTEYAFLLRQCTQAKALLEGKKVHAHMMRSKYSCDTFLGNLVVDMYGKCGSSPENLYLAFSSISSKNVVSWSILIGALTMNDHADEAIEMFRRMILEGDLQPNKVTYLNALAACSSSSSSSSAGRFVHALVIESGYDSILPISNTLMSMYGKLGCVAEARAVFDGIPQHCCQKNVVSWNCMLAAYVRNGWCEHAFDLYQQMDLHPDRVTFLALLDGCESLEYGRWIHETIVRCKFLSSEKSEIVVWNALVNMYGKCKSISEAISVFEKMILKDDVTWSSIITACSNNAEYREALKYLRKMDLEGMKPSMVTFVSVIDACGNLKALFEGQQIHSRVIDGGAWKMNAIVGNSLVNMYAKCNCLHEARNTFETYKVNLISWNTMITAYMKHGLNHDALKLLQTMDHVGMKPDKITLVSCLPGLHSSPLNAEAIHARIAQTSAQSDVIIANALLAMYCGKLGNLLRARHVFDRLGSRNLISWTMMLRGYVEHGYPEDALKLFRHMDLEGVTPDGACLVAIIDACTILSFLRYGQHLHEAIALPHPDTVVGNALVNMYGRCGSLREARQVFENMVRDQVTWNSLMVAYAQNGQGGMAVEMFKLMDLEGVVPCSVSFLAVIFGCSNAGLVEDGHEYFSKMEVDYWAKPTDKHYRCMIDLLGKAGWLDKAEDLITNMPFYPHPIAWAALLGACKTHNDLPRAARIGQETLEMQLCLDKGVYLTISNVYSCWLFE